MLETIVAVFVLTSGVVGAFSLASFSLSVSARSIQEVVAVNLAREGAEIVRNKRDTNWLSDTLVSCPAMGSGQSCYENWDQGIEGLPPRDYQINDLRDNQPPSVFAIIQRPTDYALAETAEGAYVNGVAGPVVFYRKITVFECTSADPQLCPTYTSAYPELVVISSVWWQGRRCPAVSEPDFTPCKVVVVERLTNWKNY
jgi:hypothetical protein